MWTRFNATIVKEEQGLYLLRLDNGVELTATCPQNNTMLIKPGKIYECRSKQGLVYIASSSPCQCPRTL